MKKEMPLKESYRRLRIQLMLPGPMVLLVTLRPVRLSLITFCCSHRPPWRSSTVTGTSRALRSR